MKHLLKRVVALALVLLMALTVSVTAFAASPSITFNGYTDGFDFQPGSEYTETDLFGSFKGVMPGDVLTETITFTNSAKDCDFVQLYMRAVAHDENNPLSEKVAETETVATMTEFLSQLSMKVWSGTELIYEASPDELDGLAENVLLGTFRTGETATLTVELTVPVELGNEFAERVGEVDWVFHVEAYNESQLTVRKVWSDGNSRHQGESITVNLLKDGNVDATAVLNAENGWVHTFDHLAEGHSWSVEEAKVPTGYTASYETVGNTVTITNRKNVPERPPVTPPPTPAEPEKPVNLTVRKVWSNDDGWDRPDFVTVTLCNGQRVYETVKLSKANGWTYSWDGLDASGNWQIVEINIPRGYTPTYSVSGEVVTITNTWRLLQTGQLNWPVWVLGGAGIALIALGGAMVLAKRKRNDA